ncbi:MAG: type II toxin-antitoxin system HicB family antitoxin [Chloroflexi bacterium]|nr:type II toxin-antitoxin system HicB family antitoxin [Chloroflexota bacterium]
MAALTDYIQVAMHRAEYEKLEDGTFYGQIPGLNGLYGSGKTLESCREELQSALEDWIVFGLRNRATIPSIDHVDLNVARVG